MDKLQLLAQKNPLTLYEAARLLPLGIGGSVAAVSVLVDAINANELTAAIKRWPTHYRDGDINQLETTVQRRDLDAWLKTKGPAVAVPVVSNLEFAQVSHAEKQRTAARQGKSKVDDPMTSDTTACKQNVWAAALGQVESARIKYLAENSAITMHRISGTRTSALLAVIAHAKTFAVDSTDYHSVWTVLVELAASASPPSPLLGQVEHGERITYDAGNKVKSFSKDALRDIMSRAPTERAK